MEVLVVLIVVRCSFVAKVAAGSGGWVVANQMVVLENNLLDRGMPAAAHS